MWKFTNKYVPNNTHGKIGKFSRNSIHSLCEHLTFFPSSSPSLSAFVVFEAFSALTFTGPSMSIIVIVYTDS